MPAATDGECAAHPLREPSRFERVCDGLWSRLHLLGGVDCDDSEGVPKGVGGGLGVGVGGGVCQQESMPRLQREFDTAQFRLRLQLPLKRDAHMAADGSRFELDLSHAHYPTLHRLTTQRLASPSLTSRRSGDSLEACESVVVVEFDAVDIDRLTVVAVLSLHLGCVIALGL